MQRSLEQPHVIPDDPESEHEETPEHIERTIQYVDELLNPRTGDELRNLVKTELYKNAPDKEERDKAVQKAGFNPKGLEALGSTLKDSLGSHQPQMDVNTAEYEHVWSGFQLVASEKNGKIRYHTSLTIGATAELSRQMRKILAATIAKDSAAKNILNASHATVGREHIERFVALMDKGPAKVVARQNEMLLAIPSSENEKFGPKRQEYAFAARHLARYTLDRLGKRSLSRG